MTQWLMVKIISFLFLLFFFYSDASGQNIQVPKDLYGIKDPATNLEKKCKECLAILRNKPADVRFGTFAQDGFIYFIITDPFWYSQLFKNAKDGIAVDIIDKNWYACGKKNKLVESWAHHGYLMKPMFLKEMNQNLYKLDNGSLIVKYAAIPKELNAEDLEYNLLILKNNYKCHYSNFYDVSGQKWKLLEMGLFMDTLTENKNTKIATWLTKDWRFEIPFEKNKSEFRERDVKPIYDSLDQNDFFIKSISIKAYSSVEGSLENNIELQEKRANSILKALQSFQGETIYASIQASENWVEFLEDVSVGKFAYFKNLSKDEIKLKLENKDISNELEPILKRHRKAILIIELEKKLNPFDNDTIRLHQKFDSLILEKNGKAAIEIQQIIFSKIRENKIPGNFIRSLEIPEKIEFGMLLNNNAVFQYREAESELYTSIKQFTKLLEIMPNNVRIMYNLCVLNLQAWIIGEAAIDPVKLKSDIQFLEKGGIDPLLVKRLLINYHIILSEYQSKNRLYEEKDKTVKYIYDNYLKLNLGDNDVLRLSQYFVAFHKYDWAEKLLATKAIRIDVSEDLLFYYINLTIVQPELTKRQSYRTIMLNAINLNKERYCALFKPFGRGGITFQLLDNDYLKKTYCENCK